MLEIIRFDEIATILSWRRWIYPLSIKHNSIWYYITCLISTNEVALSSTQLTEYTSTLTTCHDIVYHLNLSPLLTIYRKNDRVSHYRLRWWFRCDYHTHNPLYAAHLSVGRSLYDFKINTKSSFNLCWTTNVWDQVDNNPSLYHIHNKLTEILCFLLRFVRNGRFSI